MNNGQTIIKKVNSIFQLSAIDANGNVMNLDFYKGRVCLIVNMTTKDENSLEKLKMISQIYRKYKDKGQLQQFVVGCSEFSGNTLGGFKSQK